MKLSCLPVSLFDQIVSGKISIEQWAKMARSHGYDAIDISILFIKTIEDVNTLKDIRKKIEDIDMHVAMVTTYPDFTHPDAIERKEQLSLERKYIEMAAAIGAQSVRITSGQAHPGIQDETAINWALSGLLGCEKTAAANGIQLLLENHGKPGVWEYTDFDQRTEIFLRLAEGIRGSSIKVNFDTANPVVGNVDVVSLLKQVIDQIGWIHVADTDKADILHHVVIGTGLVPFDDVFRCLKDHEYDGWLSVEEGSGQGEKGIAAASQFVRTLWKNT